MNIKKSIKKRTQIRLEPATLDAIDREAKWGRFTRTDVIVGLLTKLHRAIVFDRVAEADRESLTHRMRGNKDATTVVNVRLPNIFIEFCQLNKYNLSQAIRTAAHLYLPKPKNNNDYSQRN